jgi:hypothetical protein
VKLDCWEGEYEDLDELVIVPKYSGIWVTFDFGEHGKLRVLAGVGPEEEPATLKDADRDQHLATFPDAKDAPLHPWVLVQAYVAIEADDNVKEVRISPDGDDVWFWTHDPTGVDEDDNELPWVQDDRDELSDETMARLIELGVEPMWNECPGFYNEACLAPIR